MSLNAASIQKIRPKSGLVLGFIIILALIAFETFNYSTTEYALSDLLGGLTFAGIAWSTILSIAFCGIDFAGIARLFVPETGAKEPKEAWYLFAAWLLAATMNAILTWWGVSMAIVNHAPRSTSVVDAVTLTRIVPVFVAVMVLVIRVLIIGTLSTALQTMVQPERRPAPAAGVIPSAPRPSMYRTQSSGVTPRPIENDESSSERTTHLEPTYQPLMARSRAADTRPVSVETPIKPFRKL